MKMPSHVRARIAAWIVPAVLLLAGRAQAGGVVTDCTETALRAALAGGGSVAFTCSGTIVLASPLVINATTLLDGTGQQVTLSGNDAVRVIENRSTLTLRRITIANGRDPVAGGLLNVGGATIRECTFIGNEAPPNPGSPSSNGAGAIASTGPLVVERCTFQGNRATASPGANSVAAINAGNLLAASTPSNLTVRITNCTFAGNTTATGDVVRVGFGRAALVEHCTFAGNTGVSVTALPTQGAARTWLTVRNSAFGLNTGANASGNVTDGGYNFSADTAAPFTHPTTIRGVNPLLGALGNNGGPTLTLPPQAGSPLIDNAAPSGTLAEDQRGVARPQGYFRDIGAVESPGSNAAGVVRFALSAAQVEETGGILPVQVNLAGAGVETVSVRLATVNGTAAAGTDFTAVDQELVFLPGEFSKNVLIPIADDAEIESPEAFSVRLTAPSTGLTIANTNLNVTLFSNETGMWFGAAASSTTEGAGPVSIQVVRSGDLRQGRSFVVHATAGTATAGSDFSLPPAGIAYFGENQASTTVSVSIIANTTHEPTETVTFSLANPWPSDILLSPLTHTLTILDDDADVSVPPDPGTGNPGSGTPGDLHLAPVVTRVAEASGSVRLRVQRTGGTLGQVSVRYATAGGTAEPGADFVETEGTVVFAAGESNKTVEIALVVDSVDEADEIFQVRLSQPTNGATLGYSTATILVQDGVRDLTNCTQEALEAAMVGGGTVRFTCDGVIPFFHRTDVFGGVVLDANGHDVTFSPVASNSFFRVADGNTLELVGFKLVGGVTKGTVGRQGDTFNGITEIRPGKGLGGAVEINGATFRAADCEFSGNRSEGGDGGVTSDFYGQSGGEGQGGAVHALNAQVDLQRCFFLGNLTKGGLGLGRGGPRGGAARGGALHAENAVVRMSLCQFSENQAEGGTGSPASGDVFGGALSLAGGVVEIDRCQLIGNSAWGLQNNQASGGAMHATGSARVSMHGSRLSSNSLRGGDASVNNSFYGRAMGGGIWSDAILMLEACTVDGNEARPGGLGSNLPPSPSGAGGGIWNRGHLSLRNCTIHRNVARSGDFFSDAHGGGLYSAAGTVTARSTTWTENDLVLYNPVPGVYPQYGFRKGGGVFSTNSTVWLQNCLLNGNVGGGDVWGPVTDAGHNLASSAAGFTHPASVNNTNALTGVLAELGGPVPVVPLLPGSPALDRANPATSPLTDARGMPRPYGAGPDIGAYERTPGVGILGSVTGRGFDGGTSVVVRVNGVATNLLASGQLLAFAPTAGVHTVTLEHPDWVFVPNSRLVAALDLTFGVDFVAYPANCVEMSRQTAGTFSLFYATAPNQAVELFATPTLLTPQWTSLGVFTSDANGLLTLPVTEDTPGRVFRFELK